MQWIRTQNLECVSISVQKLWRVPNFKFRSRDDHAHFMGQFVVRWLVHTVLSERAKHEVSIFNSSKDIKETQNFEVGHVT